MQLTAIIFSTLARRQSMSDYGVTGWVSGWMSLSTWFGLWDPRVYETIIVLVLPFNTYYAAFEMRNTSRSGRTQVLYVLVSDDLPTEFPILLEIQENPLVYKRPIGFYHSHPWVTFLYHAPLNCSIPFSWRGSKAQRSSREWTTMRSRFIDYPCWPHKRAKNFLHLLEFGTLQKDKNSKSRQRLVVECEQKSITLI